MSSKIAVQEFRNKFVIPNKNILRWFPGHMNRGIKQMQQQLKNVDCVAEVHDARIPFSGRNPLFKQTVCGVRPHILVLNKVDLTNPHLKTQIKERLKEEGYQNVIFSNCKVKGCGDLIPMATSLIKSANRFNRSEKRELSMLIIGVPNVGKSSLINALRNKNLKKSNASPVGVIAGITRSVLTRIKVCEDPPMYLLDTPGILTPYTPNIEVGMKLALCSCFNDDLIGVEYIADYLLYWLNKQERYYYLDILDLKEPCDNISMVLTQGAVNMNKTIMYRHFDGTMVSKPDTVTVARILVNAFRTGKLGRHLLDEDILYVKKL